LFAAVRACAVNETARMYHVPLGRPSQERTFSSDNQLSRDALELKARCR
jgi:hypothetical protein